RAIRCMEEIREFSELDARFDESMQTYSAGMLARLYFSAATSMPSAVYLIDELLAVGDEHFQAKCWQRLRTMRAKGVSGVLVTHDWTAVLRICQEACILERGRVVASGTPEKMVSAYLENPQQDQSKARFARSIPMQHEIEVGSEATFDCQVELLQCVPVALSFSVEVLR